MKVHPIPRNQSITLRYDVVSRLAQSGSLPCRQKKLRRLPHIFAKVLELPFHSDADVSVQETPDFLKFVVPADEVFGGDVRAHTIVIHPGVIKIVIRGNHAVVDDLLLLDELDLDAWRFRLPASTRPELATAAYSDGELVVLIPKGGVEEVDDEDDVGVTVAEGGAGRLVLVQY